MSEEQYYDQAVQTLKKLIGIRSYSGEEDRTADLISDILVAGGFKAERKGNNVWAFQKKMKPGKPLILLNSHHDTVKAGSSWTKDPFTALEEGGKLFGLGSNDAGAPLICLLMTFLRLTQTIQEYNLCFLASAEEETSGKNGVPVVLDELGEIDLAIVGEPTSMDMAIAERGLLVLDCTAKGVSGHAARNEGENAIYKALKDIEWFRNYEFGKKSPVLGGVNMTVTMIEAGRQHNVVPDSCTFVVDVRPNDQYSNEEVLGIIRDQTESEIMPRSTNLNASGINPEHPVVMKAKSLGMRIYGSQTMSDQVHMPFPSVKIGPGDTRRSHTADEFVYLEEIGQGLKGYFELLNGLKIDG
ncbi:M20 family metallo-hydrolase [Balneola sp. MJW-20]|uniref:M20 family metallo-hydrolase n=1 Tax=Gracilimonas aurantiaca TaxID=3234185 RepID=UPI003465FBC0